MNRIRQVFTMIAGCRESAVRSCVQAPITLHRLRNSVFALALVVAGLAPPQSLAQPTSGAAAASSSASDFMRRAVERRAVEAVIWGMPAVNYDLMRQEMLDATSAEVGDIIYWGRPLDWMNQTLTPNPDTLYFMTFLDTSGGPIVLEVPPAEGGALNGNIVTAWQMPLEDVGLLGVDKGAGIKLAILPPGYAGALPAEITGVQSDTFGNFALLRVNLPSRAAGDIAKALDYGRRLKVYPLAAAGNPPPTKFVNAQTVLFDSTIRFDSTFFEHLNRVVQEEQWLDRDRAMIDALKSIGIEKSKPFRPDGERRAMLDAAAVEAKHYLDALYEAGWGTFFDGTQWRAAAPAALARAAETAYRAPDSYPTDLRGVVYTLGFIGIKRLGVGQFYLLALNDADSEPLDGAKSYRLTVPPNPPVDQYWSATVYDRQTHALVRHMARASRASSAAEVAKNADGSVDVFFGPSAPPGKESNWVPTDPERGFEVMFRLYGPTKALFDRAWALPDIEKAEAN